MKLFPDGPFAPAEGSPARSRHAAGWRACALLERLGRAAVVGVAVGDENMRDRLALQRIAKHIELLARRRAGIDHRHLPFADHIKVRAFEGERARIVADDAPQARRDALEHAILKIHLARKGGRLVFRVAQGNLATSLAAKNFGRAPGLSNTNLDCKTGCKILPSPFPLPKERKPHCQTRRTPSPRGERTRLGKAAMAAIFQRYLPLRSHLDDDRDRYLQRR